MEKSSSLNPFMDSVGVYTNLKDTGIKDSWNEDLKFRYVIMSLCLKGSIRGIYDGKEYKQEKNSLALILPGHSVKVQYNSKDYTHAWMIFDTQKFKTLDLIFRSHNEELMGQNPVIQLTNEQTKRVLVMARVIEDIAEWDDKELPNKHQLLETQLTLAYELYIAIRRKQDSLWYDKKDLYKKFCILVTQHYKEERDVNYYATVLGYDARYFSKVIRSLSGGISALEWIGNYIVEQAKQYMDNNPRTKIREVSEYFGFPSTAGFCRYFKRITGIYPMEYKKRDKRS